MDPERIKMSTDLGVVAMVDEATGFAFGPTFKNEWEAEGFLEFLTEEGVENPMELSDGEFLEYLMRYIS